MENKATTFPKRALITGANGFIGTYLCAEMQKRGLPFRAAVRHDTANAFGHDLVTIGSISGKTDWSQALQNIETVIHLAARAHVIPDLSLDALNDFRKINVDATLSLARQAAASGVRRFIFISSIKVNGEETFLGHPYTVEQTPAPADSYGISKQEAEEALKGLAKKTSMEIVIIRPPLVYGPGVKGNFRSMMKWLIRDFPLPFGSIKNKRSLVSVDNLIDLIILCINHPAAANQVFLVSDGEDLSTPELLQRTASALGKTTRLLPVPIWLLQFSARLLKKKTVVQKLCGSLQVDIDYTCKQLGWTPPISVNNALFRTAEDYLRSGQ